MTARTPLEEQRSQLIYKIVSRHAWEEACKGGAFEGSAADVHDKFIHLSAPHQLAGTAAKHFRGQAGLLLAAFDSAALGPALKWEPSRGGDLFPHLYAPLPTAASLWTKPLALGDDGVPLLPGDIEGC